MPTRNSKQRGVSDPTDVTPKSDKGELRVIIETPKGSRNKYAFDEEAGAFALRKVLPAGMTFPYDFGFIPRTKAEDGDPLDVLVLMDDSAFPGCAVDVRLIGVMRAEAEEEGETVRNDRLIAVATLGQAYSDTKSLEQLGEALLKDLERFFVTYQKLLGKKFKLLGRGDAEEAMKLAKKAGLQTGKRAA